MATLSSKVLTEYVPNQIWLSDYPIRYAGCRFNARMTIIRLSDGSLLIHSPCPIDDDTRNEIGDLGPVSVIIAPGSYHYFNVESARAAFPDAEVHICPGVEKKEPALACAKILDDTPDPAWAEDLDQVLIRGSHFVTEVAFFHRKSATLVLVDLIENYGDETEQPGGIMKFGWQLIFRMWNNPKPAPEYQMGWRDKASARQSLEKILSWKFERIIIAHGDLIEKNAEQVARSAWQTVLKLPSSAQALSHQDI